MYGKQKENRATGQKFSDWVQEMFPGLNKNDTADSIWFATNSPSLGKIPAAISNPQLIRQWFNEQQATADLNASLPPDILSGVPVEKTQKQKSPLRGLLLVFLGGYSRGTVRRAGRITRDTVQE